MFCEDSTRCFVHTSAYNNNFSQSILTLCSFYVQGLLWKENGVSGQYNNFWNLTALLIGFIFQSVLHPINTDIYFIISLLLKFSANSCSSEAANCLGAAKSSIRSLYCAAAYRLQTTFSKCLCLPLQGNLHGRW